MRFHHKLDGVESEDLHASIVGSYFLIREEIVFKPDADNKIFREERKALIKVINDIYSIL